MPLPFLDYLRGEQVGVLAVEMLDGSPHAATIHFKYTDEPLEFFFGTEKDSLKAQPLLKKSSARASFVVGTDEKNMKTLQVDGIAKLVPQGDLEAVKISFTPTWWRFTDWTTPEGKKIWTSNK